MCVCAAEPEPVPSLPTPGPTHQAGLPLAGPCQGTQVRGREGTAQVAATACAASLVSWHSFLLLLSARDTLLICRKDTDGEAVVVGGGVQDSPPVNHRAGNSRWDPDWPQGRPCSCSGPGGRPLQACPQQAVKPFEKLASICRAELPDCGQTAAAWPFLGHSHWTAAHPRPAASTGHR